MQAFIMERGIVIPLDRPNVDTDSIIPKQFLKSVQRSGFGRNLSDGRRYLDRGEPGKKCLNRPLNPEFILNQFRYRGGIILLARENFGCGSSREHAVWALNDFGIRVLIAPSFADIFFNNTSKNGILAITLAEGVVNKLFVDVQLMHGYQLTIDLKNQVLVLPNDETISFDMDTFKKDSLLNGLDDIDIILRHADDIEAYERHHKKKMPWLFL